LRPLRAIPSDQPDQGQADTEAAGLNLLPQKTQLAFSAGTMTGAIMLPHTRAMIAAAAYAFITGKKVAGMHDHAFARDLQIAAESRGHHLQGFDGDRSVQFGGTLPELFDAGSGTFVSLEINGANARGFDRGSSGSYVAQVSDSRVQVYDYSQSTWFTFSIQVA